MLEISEEAWAKVVEREGGIPWPEKLDDHPTAVQIWGTLGCSIYLTPDGLLLSRDWNWQDEVGQVRMVEDHSELNAMLTVSCTNVPELAELLPEKPGGATACATCKGAVLHGFLALCQKCDGLGWCAE